MSILITNDDGYRSSGSGIASSNRVGIRKSDRGRLPTVSIQGVVIALVKGAPSLSILKVIFDMQSEGRPADCARIALSHLAPETQWVFSGIKFRWKLGV